MKKLISFILIAVVSFCLMTISLFAAETVVLSENFNEADASSLSDNFTLIDANYWDKANESTDIDVVPLTMGIDEGVFMIRWIGGRLLAVNTSVMPTAKYIITADMMGNGPLAGLAIRQISPEGKIYEGSGEAIGLPKAGCGVEGIQLFMDSTTGTATITYKVKNAASLEGVDSIKVPVTLPSGVVLSNDKLVPIMVVDNGDKIYFYLDKKSIGTIELSGLADNNYGAIVVKDATGAKVSEGSNCSIPALGNNSFAAFVNRENWVKVDNFMLYSSDGSNDGTKAITGGTATTNQATNQAATSTPVTTQMAGATPAKTVAKTPVTTEIKTTPRSNNLGPILSIIGGVIVVGAAVAFIIIKKKK